MDFTRFPQEDYPYRGPREDPHTGRPLEFG